MQKAKQRSNESTVNREQSQKDQDTIKRVHKD